MKFLKLAVITLAVAVVTDYALTQAYTNQSGVGILLDLVKNEHQDTSVREKTNYSTQTYENFASSTPLTSPCPKCQIATRLHCVDTGDTIGAIITVAGETKDFNINTVNQNPGNYYLEVWREDWTLLETHHSGQWMFNRY